MENNIQEDIFSSPDYRRSRAAYTAQCAFEYLVTLLVTDAFLATLLANLGISDAMIGIISSLTSLAFVVQLFSLSLTSKGLSAKKVAIFCTTVSQILYFSLYLLPLFPLSEAAKTVLPTLFVVGGTGVYHISLNMCYRWGNSFVSPTGRGRFGATKEMISLFSGMVFTTAVGFFFDRIKESGNEEGALLFVAMLILVNAIANIVCLCLMKKDEVSKKEQGKKLSDILKNTMGNKNYRSVVWMTVLWNMAQYFTIGYLGVYKTGDLMMSVLLVQIINTVGAGVRMAGSRPFGSYSDRTSFARGISLGLILAAIAFFANIFTTPETWYFIIVYTVLYNLSMAGVNANSYNVLYSYVDSDYFVEALAIKNSIGGICGFATSILAGVLLDLVQKNGNTLFGIQVYGQQLLSAISFVLTVATFLLVKLVIEKQRVMKQ